MTPRERLLATFRGQPHDRVPLILQGFLFATREQVDKLKDPEHRRLALRVFDETATIVSHNSRMNRWMITPPQFIRKVAEQETPEKVATTRRIETPRGPLTAVTEKNRQTETIWTLKYPVENLEDLEKLRSIRWELPAGLAPPEPAKLPASLKTRTYLHSGVSSPFVCVAGAMSYEYFLELCATHFDRIRELTELCTERLLRILDVILSNRLVEVVWMGGCEWLTPPMGSPKLYEALVQGPEKRVIERIHAAGALSEVHCHGKVGTTIRQVVERGADYFEPMEPPPDGDITMAQAKRVVAGRMTLGGNVEARVIAYGSEDDVERAARAAFEGGKERMVLSTTAAPIAAVTGQMVRNYDRLIDVWEELSPI